MTVKYKEQVFLTDKDLKINILGFWPRWDIKNKKLREMFKSEFDRDFLGADEIISYRQSLVASGTDFSSLEEEILGDIKNPEKPSLKEIVFKKTATGIGRGHSLGGLAGVVLGVNGTKMIDSGLTGFVASRSLVTSSRRRETTVEEIIIPNSLMKRKDLLDEYLEISRDVFKVSKEFKERFGKLGGVETFNKVIPYNNPSDLFIVMPLDTMATLAFEVKQDRLNQNGTFLPRELVDLSDMFSIITEETGMGVMYKQRIRVPRDTYLHYTVFKDPSLSNYPLERAKERGMSLEPLILEHNIDFTNDFKNELEKLENIFEETKKIDDPEDLVDGAEECMLALRSFCNDYNEAVRVKVLDSLSWRVWSEQKRHATLRQNVESVYSAADRAYKIVKAMWPLINSIYEDKFQGDISELVENVEKAIVMDDRLKNQPELLVPYIYNTARQLMFYGKLLDEGFEQRDALYIVPKNIRVRTLEHYDLINSIDLELPLRSCSTCEPERNATSRKKIEVIAKAIPELAYFLEPKCNIGFCTEGKYCDNIVRLRKGNYNQDLHKQVKQYMLSRTR